MTSILFDTDDNEWIYRNSETDRIDFEVVKDRDLSHSDREEIDRELTRLIMGIQAQQARRNAEFDEYRSTRRSPDEYHRMAADHKAWRASANTLKGHAVAAKQANFDVLKQARRDDHARRESTTPAEKLARSATGAMTSILAALLDGDEYEATCTCRAWLDKHAARIIGEMTADDA